MGQKHGNIAISKLDSNMKAGQFIDKGFRWYNPKEHPEIVYGFPWFMKERIYRRLPEKPDPPVRREVDSLADCTSGGQIRILTDTRRLAVRVKLAGPANMIHMPATGQCGFDCYVNTGEGMRYCSTSKYNYEDSEYEYIFFELEECKTMEVILNFPLYQGVHDVWVGVDEDTGIFKPYPFQCSSKAIFYGTSITQGGCASRPGMSYTNILSRKLDMECINFGFSGNGKGEPELAKIISTLEDISLIVLDYEANTWSGLLQETLVDFIKILREYHQVTPILILSKIIFSAEVLNPASFNRLVNAEFQRKLVQKLNEEGDSSIMFYDGSQLLGNDFDECTVDGIHLTDLGFYRMAEKLVGVINSMG